MPHALFRCAPLAVLLGTWLGAEAALYALPASLTVACRHLPSDDPAAADDGPAPLAADAPPEAPEAPEAPALPEPPSVTAAVVPAPPPSGDPPPPSADPPLPPAAPAAAPDGTTDEAPAPPPSLVVGLGLSLGSQFDGRDCATAGRGSSIGGTCLLFAGGVDISLLHRGRLGATLGLFSVSGVAAAINEVSSTPIPAIPDRVSLPLLFDIRPLAFLPAAQRPGYASRVLHGVGVQLGPSLEIVRTSSDQATSVGGLLRLQAEVPLHGAPRHGVSLRFAAHLLLAPIVSLNGGTVRSVPFDVCTDPGCPSVNDHFHGYGPVYQGYLGLVYYP